MISRFSPTNTRMVVLRHARQLVELSLLRDLLPFMLTEEKSLGSKLHNSYSSCAVLSCRSSVSQAVGSFAAEGFVSVCSTHTLIQFVGLTDTVFCKNTHRTTTGMIDTGSVHSLPTT